MRKTFGTVPILTGNEFPGRTQHGPAAFKGQLFLENTTGNYYKALEAGPDAEWVRVVMLNPYSDNLLIEEDLDNPGFAKITIV